MISVAWFGLGAVGQETLALSLPMFRELGPDPQFVLVDRDRVTAANHRQLPRTYPADSVGLAKTALAARRIAEGLPEALVEERPADLTRMGLKRFREHDLVVACLDNRLAQCALSDALFLSGSRAAAVFLNCDAGRAGAQAVTLQPGRTGCLPESWTQRDDELVQRASSHGCGGREAASASPEAAALAASLGAWAIRRLLQGDLAPLGTDLRLSLRDATLFTLRHPQLGGRCPYLNHRIELGSTRSVRLEATPDQVSLDRLATTALDKAGPEAMLCLRLGQEISIPELARPILGQRYVRAGRLRGVAATLAQLRLGDPQEAFLVLDPAAPENRLFITF
jgi:molybdopterin/thiamine biosynthesis adenylyltransferase